MREEREVWTSLPGVESCEQHKARLTIDVERLTKILGQRASNTKSGRASLASGTIVIRLPPGALRAGRQHPKPKT